MWLLEASVFERLRNVLNLGLEAEFRERASMIDSPSPVATSASEGLAVINVEGILTKKPSGLIRFFYGANTAYDDIIAQLASAESDPRITGVRLDVDSPGGEADGLFATLDAIAAFSKPITVFATNALSAAYGIAAAGGKIMASGRGAQFGSVGAATELRVRDDVVTLTSSNAPEKRPDPKTEAGRKSIVAFLDQIEGLYVDAIAKGRGVSGEQVRSGYGRGAIVLAEEAEKRGMIDGIAGAGLRVVKTEPQATAQSGSEDKMDLETLKAQHPAVYQAAVAVGIELGVQQEQERVNAHLNLAEEGDMDVALEAIKSGAGLTPTVYSKHMKASLARNDIRNRNADDDDAREVVAGIKSKPKGEDAEKKVTDAFLSLVGNADVELGEVGHG